VAPTHAPVARRWRSAAVALAVLPLAFRPAIGQLPADLARERADFAAWLAEAPTSPLGAVAQQPIGPGIRLGPADADIPLAGIPEHRVTERSGTVRLDGPSGRVLPRGAAVPLGNHTLTAEGEVGRTTLMVFGPTRRTLVPAYYAYRPDLVVTGTLTPPVERGLVDVLGVDGVEVEGAEAGSIDFELGAEHARLRVLRLPTGDGEESELEVFFRDGSNGRGSYPAGRFVALEPSGGGRYRLDFNRARNPFCAYSSVYACPAPWRGNALRTAVEAGERYEAAP
jgi:uncharacterized protein DUF1684